MILRPTDDLRIERLRPLIPPAILMEQYEITEEASDDVAEARECDPPRPARRGRPAPGGGRALLHPRLAAAREYAGAPPGAARAARRRPGDGHARLLREAAHHRRLEGPDQRPATSTAASASTRACAWRAACCSTSTSSACRRAASSSTRSRRSTSPTSSPWGAIGARTTESQVHRELASGLSCRSASRTAPTATCRSRSTRSRAAAQPHHFLVGDQAGRWRRSSRRAGNADCHVILRGGKQRPELRRRRASRPPASAARAGPAPPADDRLLSHGNSGKNQRASRRGRRTSPRQVAAGDAAHRRRDGGEPPRRRPPGPRPRPAAHLRPEHHRRLHRLGRHRAGAGRPRQGRPRAPREGRVPEAPSGTRSRAGSPSSPGRGRESAARRRWLWPGREPTSRSTTFAGRRGRAVAGEVARARPPGARAPGRRQRPSPEIERLVARVTEGLGAPRRPGEQRRPDPADPFGQVTRARPGTDLRRQRARALLLHAGGRAA